MTLAHDRIHLFVIKKNSTHKFLRFQSYEFVAQRNCNTLNQAMADFDLQLALAMSLSEAAAESTIADNNSNTSNVGNSVNDDSINSSANATTRKAPIDVAHTKPDRSFLRSVYLLPIARLTFITIYYKESFITNL